MRDRLSSAVVEQLQSDIQERPRSIVIANVVSHATVGEPFTVDHGLGVKPSMVLCLPRTQCVVWAEESDERLWTARKVVLRCSVALASMRLEVVSEG